jgi:predicted nuclease of predicted toxin-antitoxin system
LKFLIDECVWRGAGRQLEAEGHDVAYVAPERRGAPDEGVLEIAEQEDRIVITLDRRMAYLVATAEFAPRGLVVLRENLVRRAGELLAPLLNMMPGNTITIDSPEKRRIRPMTDLGESS